MLLGSLVQMLLGPGGRRSLNKSKCYSELGLVVKVAQQVQMLLRARAGGRGRSTSPSPNVTLGLVVEVAQQVQMLLKA